jgi:hypothetical protein
MQFGRLDLYIMMCEQHLDATNARNTEIESYLVQFLLTRICAEYETRIAALVERRCSRMKDLHVRSFTKRTAKDACRRFDISEIKGILGLFGEDYKQGFHDRVINTSAHTAWDNIYANRKAVAHGGGAQMSFPDLRTNYTESLAVLDALVVVLGLKPREIRSFT